MHLQELKEKDNVRYDETTGKRVRIFLQSSFYLLDGDWQWEMTTDAVFCSDVMLLLQEEFVGTKAIFYPDDVAALKEKITSRQAIPALTFRIITTYGDVKTVTGENIVVIEEVTHNWEEDAVLIADETGENKAEHTHLQLLKEIDDRTVRFNVTGYWYYNAASHKTWYADSVYVLHGLPAQSLNAHLHTFHPFVHPEDKASVTEFTDKAFRNRAPLHIEYRIVVADTEKWISYKVVWFYSHKGEEVMGGIYQDITDQKKAEREAESYKSLVQFQRQQALYDEQQVNFGHWQINLLTRKATYSDQYYRIFGIKPHSIVPTISSFLNYVHPDDRGKVEAAHKQIIHEHAVPELEYRILRNDGKTRFILQKARLVMVEQEMVVAGIIQDITVQRMLEKKVAGLNDAVQLRLWLSQKSDEQTNLVSWVMDLDENTISWSDSFYKLAGHPKMYPTNVTEKTLFSLVHPQDIKTFQSQWGHAVNERQEASFNLRLLVRGVVQYMKAAFSVYTHNDKNYFIGTLQNITAEQVLQQQLSHRVHLAETLSENTFNQVIITDSHNTVLLWNRASEQALGIKRTDAIGQNFFDLFPQLKTEAEIQLLNRVLHGEKVVQEGVPFIFGKGYYNVYLVPLYQDGDVSGILHIVHDVTREVELRNRLNNRLQLIEGLVQSSVDRIIALDRNLNYLYWNKKAGEYYGLKKEEVLGKNILDVFPGLVNDPSYSEIRKALRGETVHIPVNPEAEAYFETYLIPITDENGEVTSLLWMARDLSKEWALQKERQEAQKQLEKQSHFLRRILDTVPDMVSVMELPSRKLQYLNKDVFLVNGFDTDAMANKSREELVSIVHPDDRQLLSAYYEKLSTTSDKELVTAEYRAKTAAGEWRWFLVRGKVFRRDDTGQVTQILNVIENITEHKSTAQEISRLKDEIAQQAEDKYRTLFNSVNQGFYHCEVIYDDSYNPVDIRYLEENPAAVRITGISLVGKTMKETDPAFGDHWFSLYGAALLTGESKQTRQYSELYKKWFDFQILKIGNDSGREVVVIFQDITDLKTAEERQAYLLELSDALRTLVDPITMQATAARLLGKHLKTDRAYYVEINEKAGEFTVAIDWHHPGSPSHARRYPIEDWSMPWLHDGKTWVLRDTETDPALSQDQRTSYKGNNIGAAVVVPLVRDGKLVATFCTNQKLPRNWTKEEIVLVEETAARIWTSLELAYAEEALRKSEAQLAAVLQALPVGIGFFDTAGNLIISNEEMRRFLPTNIIPSQDDERHERWQAFYPDGRRLERRDFPGARALRGERVVPGVEFLYTHDDGSQTWILVAAVPVHNEKASIIGHVSVVMDVTLLKEAEEQLKDFSRRLEQQVAERTHELNESKKITEQITRTTPDRITIHDAATQQILYTNHPDFWKELYHDNEIFQKADEKRAMGLVHPDEQEKLKTFMLQRNNLLNGEVSDVEIRMKGNKWIRIRSKVFKRDENGNALEIISLTTDITESKKVEQEVQKNLTLLQNAEELAQIGSWEYDLATDIFTWSEGMYRLFGLPQGTKVRPETYLDYAVEEDRSIAKRIIKNLKKSHQPFEETVRIKRKDGVRLLKLKASVEWNEQGKARRILGVDLDITDIREAEQKVAESSNLLEQTAQASPDAISVYDLDKKQPVYLNNCLAQWLGVSSNELVRIGIEGRLKYIHADDRLRLLLFNEKLKAAKDASVLTLEYQVHGKDGRLLWIRNRARVLQRDAAGKVTHVLSVLQDITEEKAAEEVLKKLNSKLEKKNAELESANDEITSFAFVASHDLKEPLRKIHTFNDILLTREEHLSAAGRETLEKMSDSVKRLDLLIKDILALTKVHVDREKLKPVDLAALLQRLKEEMHEKLEQSGAVIEAGPLPKLLGVENQLFYLFKNLVSNGIKFQGGEGQPYIIIRAEKEELFLKVSVTDNGIGIAPEYHNRIFEIFRRLHGRTEYEGTGMGLAICKKIMEKHGGKITVESEAGKGATFTCWFPASLFTL